MSLFRTESRGVRLLPLALAIATACASAEPVATSSLQEYPLYVSSTVLDDWLTEHPTAAIAFASELVHGLAGYRVLE